MRSGRISYEKARLIAWKATDRTVKDWIERAAGKTCISLRREIEGEEEAQMWTRGWLEIPVPRHTVELFADVCKVARALALKPLTSGECFLWFVYHFLETWKSEAKERNTLRDRVMKRDLGYCQAPGCSRRAAHVHHLEFRSHGGADSMENEIALCAAHHLVAIHEGHMRVTGRAPDQLVWEIGLKPPRPADLPAESDLEPTACQWPQRVVRSLEEDDMAETLPPSVACSATWARPFLPERAQLQDGRTVRGSLMLHGLDTKAARETPTHGSL